jgi:hypothetical protein
MSRYFFLHFVCLLIFTFNSFSAGIQGLCVQDYGRLWQAGFPHEARCSHTGTCADSDAQRSVLPFFTWVLEFKRSSWVLEHCYGGWVLGFEIGILVHGLSHTVLLIDVTYRYPMLPRIWKAWWRASPQVCEGMHCQPWPVGLESGHC